MTQGPGAEIRATGVRLTRLGFGGAAIANLFAPVPEHEAVRAAESALAMGIRHFDTAPYYGYGLSESRLGAALSAMPREELTISTKVGYALGKDFGRETGGVFAGNLPDVGVSFDYSRRGILRSLKGSRERLGTSRIEIALLHDLDPTVHRDPAAYERHRDVALGEGWPALCELREAGELAAIGFGLNHAGAAERLLDETDPDVILLAGRYTLLEHEGALPLLAACARRMVAVIIGGPFNSGILAMGSHAGAMYDYGRADAATLQRAARLEEVCRSRGVPVAAAALQFPFGHPAVATVIPGMRSEAEVRANVALMDQPVPAALWDELRERGLVAPDVPTPSA